MNWTAIVPLKQGSERKSRLSARYSQAEREKLADDMANHVIEMLRRAPSVERIAILSARSRDDGRTTWLPDGGRGLNIELEKVRGRFPYRPLLFLFADLPLLTANDIEDLLATSGTGCALAPDRHRTGTNAIALRAGTPFRLAFGANSWARHLHAAGGKGAIVARPGLAIDIDTPDDVEAAARRGWRGFPAGRN